MRLLQPCVAMATVSLLHCAERLLLVDTPKAHRAEVVQKIGRKSENDEWTCERREIAEQSCDGCKKRRLSHPSSAPVIMCSSFMSWTQSIEPLTEDRKDLHHNRTVQTARHRDTGGETQRLTRGRGTPAETLQLSSTPSRSGPFLPWSRSAHGSDSPVL